MPNSVSVPFPTLLTPASDEPGSYQTLLPEAELRRVFTEAAGGAEGFAKILSGEKQVITSCGSGMTASVVWLALQTLGAKNVALYDEVRVFCLRSDGGRSYDEGKVMDGLRVEEGEQDREDGSVKDLQGEPKCSLHGTVEVQAFASESLLL